MAIAQYLAMTAAEMIGSTSLPQKAAWMACHFSPYSTGLCNLPSALPPGSLLILNDRTPLHGHDVNRVCQELTQAIEQFSCFGLLVDFQNKPTDESLQLTAYLATHLQYPLGLPPAYAVKNAAVFIPAAPTLTRLSRYLAPWKGQEIWLEDALEGESAILTKDGTSIRANPGPQDGIIHADRNLHCHYTIQARQNSILFHTWRTNSDLEALLEDAEQEGVTLSVGLYQELCCPPKV